MDLQARTIMHLAARPNHLPVDNQFSGTAAARSLRCQFQTAGDKDGPFPPSATIPQAMQTGIFHEGFLAYLLRYFGWNKLVVLDT